MHSVTLFSKILMPKLHAVKVAGAGSWRGGCNTSTLFDSISWKIAFPDNI